MTLLKSFSNLSGAKFISLNGYKNSKGEVSNQVINVNVDVKAAKEKDLQTLKNFSVSQLLEIANDVGASNEQALTAIQELIVSAERNLSEDNKTNQSKGQTEAYTQIGKGLKFHSESGVLYLSGFANSKTIITEGEYKEVKSNPKTLVKKKINKTLRMANFRSFKISNVENINISGTTIQL